MDKYPRVGTAVLILNNRNEVLLAPRIARSGNGKYSPPGGKVEFGEYIKDAMLREVKEEANLDLNNLSVLPLVTKNMTEAGNHYVCFWGISFSHTDDHSLTFIEYDENGKPKTSDVWKYYKLMDALVELPLFGSVPEVLRYCIYHGNSIQNKASDFRCWA